MDQVWSDLFSTFVSQFGLMTVVDRFCLQRLAESARGESGIEQWLARVDASDCGNSTICVQVLSTLARGQLQSEVNTRLHDFTEALPNRRIANLEVHFVGERVFGPIVHYRYVRFQSHHCIILDHGIEILEGHALRRTHPYSFTYFDETLRGDESAIRSKSQRCIVYSRPNTNPRRNNIQAPAHFGPTIARIARQ